MKAAFQSITHRSIIVFAGLSALIGCAKQVEVTSPEAVARVGEALLYQADVDHAVLHQFAGSRSPKEALEAIVEEEALANAAIAEGAYQDPSTRAAIRRLLAARYQERHLNAAIKVDDESVQEAWEQSGDRFATPRAARVAVLRQGFNGAVSRDVARATLEAARDRFLALPADERRQGFGPIAVQASDSQDTRYQGGDCGWITEGQPHLLLPTEVIDAVKAKEGEGLLDEIVTSSDAAWLVMLTDQRQESRADFSTVAPVLRRELETIGQNQQRQQLAESVSRAFPSKILRHQIDTKASPALAASVPEMPF